MLYRIRFSFGINVHAASSEEAHLKVVKMMQDHPEGFITGIEDATLARNKGIVERLVTGK